jgi:hypothetical protein
MSAAQAELLTDFRRRCREQARSVVAFAVGQMRVHSNNVDVSAEHVATTKGHIRQYQALLQQYDPDGLTADGNIEIGEVSSLHEFREIFAGRWVSYSLDEQGRAVNLHAYDDEASARAEATVPGRYAGVVADDHWSISPPKE